MTTTLIGYFEDHSEARQTEQDLLRAGFGTGDVSIVSNAQGTTGQHASHEQGMWERMKAAFGFASQEDRTIYEEAARHGALLSVRVQDSEVDRASSIIERHHPVDLDQRIEEWRGAEGASGANLGETGPAAIPVVEEDVKIGKRDVQRGGIRVHTYVSERPIEETLNLREEHATVERRPADRPVAPGEEAFQERTIEVREMGEEAMVSKEARVVEEISVGTEAVERRETIHETERRTEVDVERDDDARSKR